jgi:hypothetical protein
MRKAALALHGTDVEQPRYEAQLRSVAAAGNQWPCEPPMLQRRHRRRKYLNLNRNNSKMSPQPKFSAASSAASPHRLGTLVRKQPDWIEVYRNDGMDMTE